MKKKNFYFIYVIIGMMGTIFLQAMPVIYQSLGFTSQEILNLISIVFLGTIFQPVIGFIADRILGQKRMIIVLFLLTALTSVILFFTKSYQPFLVMMLILSIFRLPTLPIMDGYVATITHNLKINMGLIRSGTTIGYGIGILVLMIILNLFNLDESFVFIFIAIINLIAMVILSLQKVEVGQSKKPAETNLHLNQKTNWLLFVILLMLQLIFFGASLLKVSYTSPFLIEFGYSAQVIAFTTLIGSIPVLILMPLFNKLFKTFRYTTLIIFCLGINFIQTGLFILFPSNLLIVLIGSFLTGFIFPIYSPIFGMLLRKVVADDFVSSSFTIIFTVQNVGLYVFNQFYVSNVVSSTNDVLSAFNIIELCFLFALIPLVILRKKKF